MKADVHFAKGDRLNITQTKLDPATDWELIVEGCYMAAHHLILAGTEWIGIAHAQNHSHGKDIQLLQSANAPKQVIDLWVKLENLRAGNIYGAKSNGTASSEARVCLSAILHWVTQHQPKLNP